MRRASSKRVKTGCLTCRKRHYKCDEGLPRCFNCRRSNLTCEWGPKRPAGAPDSSKASAAASPQSVVTSRHAFAGSSSMAPGYPENPEHSLTTHDIELITHFVSHFHEHNFQICAWTNLITIPQNSAIPNILRSPSRAIPKKTNWATFYLTRLTLLTPDDPLAVAMSAFTAVRMGFDRTALYLYSKGIMLLRAILTRKNASSMNDRDFLRIWATTLLLAEYESQLGEETLQYQHLAGATTLSAVAMNRFKQSPKSRVGSPSGSHQGSVVGHTSASSPGWSSAESTTSISPSGQHELEDPFNRVRTPPARNPPTTIINKESMSALPGYLMALTLRLNHSKAIRESRDTQWPSFHSPADRQGFGAVLDKVAECYKIVMPLVAAYYGRMATHPPKTREEYIEMMTGFAPDVKLAKTAIAEYQALLENFKGYEHQIFQSCARDKFPFSPVLKFVNPQMAQPMTGPHMFIMFMAPFITEQEHYEAIRYISGVFAGFHDTPGLMLDASYPDIHVAAFWKKGAQRQYFIGELSRRGGAFEIVLTRIWGIIDSVELMKNRELTPTEILGISLKEYQRAQIEGQKLKNTRH